MEDWRDPELTLNRPYPYEQSASLSGCRPKLKVAKC